MTPAAFAGRLADVGSNVVLARALLAISGLLEDGTIAVAV